MKLGIQILNYDGMHWLPALLKSLRREALVGRRIYVVDNASSDESLSYLAAAHWDVTINRRSQDRGYKDADWRRDRWS